MKPTDLAPRSLPTLAALVAIFCGGPACITTPSTPDGDATGRRDDAVEADTFTLWVHGRNTSGSTKTGDYEDFSYWGPASSASGPNPKAVNWDGRSRIADTNGIIRSALDCFCTGPRSCIVAAHSAGDVQVGYALALYGGSSRPVTNGVPDASGNCTPTGDTQVGWNIQWVTAAGGAGGGTELANLGYWAVSDPLTSDLRTDVARSMYDHDDTQGATFYMYAGASGTYYSGVLPGQDDSVIAYHSSGGLSKTGSFCNPGDWFCGGTLEYGSDPSGKVAKWANHEVSLRDDQESYDHYTNGAWAGIVGPMHDDLASANGSQDHRTLRRQHALSAYLDTAQYPPSCRPIEERSDLGELHPGAVRTLPLALPGGAGGHAQVVLSQDRAHTAAGEAATLGIACSLDGAPAACEVLSARAAPAPDMPPSAGPAAVRFEPTREGAFVSRFAPGELGFGSYHGPLRVDVALRIGGEEGHASFDLDYTPSPPAAFTGAFREALEGGSVDLFAGISVARAGRYFVRARVEDAAGRRFAFLSESALLDAGEREVKLQVFGKVALDAGARAPFRVRDLSGFRLDEDTFPDREALLPLAGVVHTTRAYAASDLSPAPWESEVKARRVRALSASLVREER